jgi:hypothetical protein
MSNFYQSGLLLALGISILLNISLFSLLRIVQPDRSISNLSQSTITRIKPTLRKKSIGDNSGRFNTTITLPTTIENLSASNKTSRNVIAILMYKIVKDEMFDRLKMLDYCMNDNHDTDLIIFHSDYINRNDIHEYRTATKRFIDFLNVDTVMTRIPTEIENFDPYLTDSTWSARSKWGYQNMIRFWFRDIFLLDVMQNVEYYLRLDDDSSFLKVIPFNIFNLMSEKKGNQIIFQNYFNIDE